MAHLATLSTTFLPKIADSSDEDPAAVITVVLNEIDKCSIIAIVEQTVIYFKVINCQKLNRTD